MAKYKEIVHMVLDLLKESSDDSFYTEEHVIFLAGRFRSFLLKQRYYSDLKKQIPESNYQTICLDLEQVNAIDCLPCVGGQYLRTVQEIPTLLPFGITRVYTSGSYYKGDIALVSRDRMKYTSYNKWQQNTIYASLDPSQKLYFTSQNPQFLYLKKAMLTGIFEDSEAASELECNADGSKACDILDRDFPIEDALVSPLIELIVNELRPSIYSPEDKQNDADDGLSNATRPS